MDTDELVSKWQKEMKKGFAKPLLLNAISKEKSYPYKLSKIIDQETNGQIKIATTNIYPLLKDLTDDGLISKIDDADSLRTYYQITQAGTDFLKTLRSSIETFMDTMNQTLLQGN